MPPPILRALRSDLSTASTSLEAIYFLSPHDSESASVWEIYPGDTADDGPLIRTGSLYVGWPDLK